MDQIEKFVKDSGLTISAYNVCFYDSNGTDEIRSLCLLSATMCLLQNSAEHWQRMAWM